MASKCQHQFFPGSYYFSDRMGGFCLRVLEVNEEFLRCVVFYPESCVYDFDKTSINPESRAACQSVRFVDSDFCQTAYVPFKVAGVDETIWVEVSALWRVPGEIVNGMSQLKTIHCLD